MSWKDIIKRWWRQAENFAENQLENMGAGKEPQESKMKKVVV